MLDVCTAYFNVGDSLGAEIRKNGLTFIEHPEGVVGDGNRLPFRDGSVDGIVLSDVLEHFDDPVTVLKSVYDALRSGGQLFLVLPAMYKLDQFHLPQIAEKRPSSHLCHYDEQRVASLLRLTGFEIEEHQGIDFLGGVAFLPWFERKYVPSANTREELRKKRERVVYELRDAASNFDIENIDRRLNDPAVILGFRQTYIRSDEHPLRMISEFMKLDPGWPDNDCLRENQLRTEKVIDQLCLCIGADEIRAKMIDLSPVYWANSVFTRARKM